MNFLNKTSISTKIIILVTALAVIFLLSSFSYVATKTEAELQKYTLHALTTSAAGESREIQIFTEDIRQTLLSMSKIPALPGIIRAKDAGGYDKDGGSSYDQWASRLATIFEAEINSSTLYDNIRYIDATGKEIVRVNNVNGVAEIVPAERLQNKVERDYFIVTNSFDEGHVYVSPTELSKEGTPPVLSVPHKPVIYYAMPLFNNKTGKKAGILVVNILMDKLVERSGLSEDTATDTFILNSKGYFILHPDKSKEWGGPNDLNTGINLQTEFPYLPELLTGENGAFSHGSQIFAYSKMRPDSGDQAREWTVIKSAASSQVFAPINTILRNTLLFGFGIFILFSFFFLLAIRRLLSPLKELLVSAKKIGSGDFTGRIVAKSEDEVGALAKEFNAMTQRLKESYRGLEEKVMLRTAELQRSEARFMLAAKSGKIGVWEWDIPTDLLIWDEQMYSLYGIKRGDFTAVYDAWREGLHPDDREAGDKAIHMALNNEKDFDTIFRVVWPSGEVRHMRAYAIVERDKEGKPQKMIGVNFDITKEREIDAEKTEFVSLASHQLRTPITAIRWNIESLIDGTYDPLSDKQLEVLKEIFKMDMRMEELVKGLLNISKIDFGVFQINPVPTNFVALCEDEIKELTPLILKKQHNIIKDYQENLPEINADQNLLRIIFLNYISNAVKYTPNNGEIKITLKTDRENILFSVANNGAPIPEEDQKKIFGKLFRASNAKKQDPDGNGLGLYVVQKIAENGGGKVWFTSHPGEDTVFYASFPLTGMLKREGEKSLSQ